MEAISAGESLEHGIFGKDRMQRNQRTGSTAVFKRNYAGTCIKG